MSEATCPVCCGLGEAEYDCRNCDTTGYDPTEDNAFGQCHNCYGEKETVQECFNCGRIGAIYIDVSEDDKCNSDRH